MAKSDIKFDIFQIIIKVLKNPTNIVKPAGKLERNCKWLQSESKWIEIKCVLFRGFGSHNQSHNILRPGQNQLIFLKHLKEYNIYLFLCPLPQLNVVSEVQATWMTRTVHPNAFTSSHNI